jgi:3-dehydroquinate dehydratase
LQDAETAQDRPERAGNARERDRAPGSERRRRGACLEPFQSNQDSALIEQVHAVKKRLTAFNVANPRGIAHNSGALEDAPAGVGIPFIEVHPANIHALAS